MLGNPKPIASLSSGLLARKGQARPAMRPQGFSLSGLAQAGDQLGWNDMGEPDPPLPAVIKAREALAESLTPEPVAEVPVAPVAEAEPIIAPAADVVATPQEVAPRAVPLPLGIKARAAFTLRLDPERHLRLRLACATKGRSAQHLVTEALDAFLANLPVVDQLARQLDRDTK